MSGRSRQGRLEAGAKWPALRASLSEHFGQGFWMKYASFAEARMAASGQFDHRERKQVLREWWDWNATAGVVGDPRSEIAYLGVEPPFDTAIDAGAFMNDFYDTLIVEVRFKELGWKP